METKSIMIVGVGGQGTLLASRIPVSYTHLDVYKRQIVVAAR